MLYPKKENQKLIGEMFDDEQFKALIKRFYYSQDIETVDKSVTISEIYREIFQRSELYRLFMLYCKENNFDIFDSTNKEKHKVLMWLHIFQQARAWVTQETVERISDIMEWKTWDNVMQPVMNEYIPDTQISLWSWLQHALIKNIPVNERGEVIYVAKELTEGYEVFSYESGIHYVNEKWELVRENESNWMDRKQVLLTLQKFQRFQLLIKNPEISDENDLLLIVAVTQSFEKDIGIYWDDVEWDTWEENIYKQRRKSYIYGMVMDLEREYKRLQSEDTTSRKWIALVWWKDVWD